ncbi:MAG TPA: DUF1175 family protein, partial [Blastocatellia bacterium]|nr:DUF1175 family protein [Blastocatellia bacterium]
MDDGEYKRRERGLTAPVTNPPGSEPVAFRNSRSRRGITLSLTLPLLLLALPSLSGCGRQRRAQADTTTNKSVAPGTPWFEDANNDGFPDSVQLHTGEDRRNFAVWFTYIAEMQFYKIGDPWNPDQRDCAGLVRFALREALRRHDHAWF